MQKTIIITGANGHLGNVLVKKFLNEQYFVIGIVHHDRKKEIRNNYLEITLDLNSEQACKTAVEKILKSQKKIDILINTAGGFAMGDINHTTSKDIQQQYQLNFETAYNISQPIFNIMCAQNYGRIFFISSKAGIEVKQAKGITAYALSKSLLFRLSELMNTEANGKNVVSTVIVPSIIDTPQNRQSMPNADFSQWVTPESIASIIHFYTTSNADNVREPIVKIYNSL